MSNMTVCHFRVCHTLLASRSLRALWSYRTNGTRGSRVSRLTSRASSTWTTCNSIGHNIAVSDVELEPAFYRSVYLGINFQWCINFSTNLDFQGNLVDQGYQWLLQDLGSLCNQ